MFSRFSLLTQVAITHWVSHLHIMAIPALLPLLPNILKVSYTELGIALGVFNTVSALVQAPLGFWVDKVGARKMLLWALALGAFSFFLLALMPNFFMLLFAMGLAGCANGVYHPADYALLSRGISPEKMGRAFSIHTFAGFVGAAMAPLILVWLTLHSDVRTAFIFTASMAVIAYIILRYAPNTDEQDSSLSSNIKKTTVTIKPSKYVILLVFTIIFMMLGLSTGAIEKFSVSAMHQGLQVDLDYANYGLTAFLFLSAVGVLAGGYLADRTSKHSLIAVAAFFFAAILMLLIIQLNMPVILLIAALGAIGFLTGMVAPSRDMLVRKVADKGSEGKVFGIVSTGFNIGGVIGPLYLGYLLDQQMPMLVLWSTVVFMLLTCIIVLAQEIKQPSETPNLQGNSN